MVIRIDGMERIARISWDNPDRKPHLIVFGDDGTIRNVVKSRDEMEAIGLQFVQTSSGEWEALSRAGFQPR